MEKQQQGQQHTPGPWKIDFGELSRIEDANGATVARLGHLARRFGGPRRAFEEVRANAALIAAAPKLLDALELFASLFEDLYHDEADEGELEIYNQAMAAICEARGVDKPAELPAITPRENEPPITNSDLILETLKVVFNGLGGIPCTSDVCQNIVGGTCHKCAQTRRIGALIRGLEMGDWELSWKLRDHAMKGGA